MRRFLSSLAILGSVSVLNASQQPSSHKLVISQGADRLRIDEHRTGPSRNLNTVEYVLNGQPVKNQFPE